MNNVFAEVILKSLEKQSPAGNRNPFMDISSIKTSDELPKNLDFISNKEIKDVYFKSIYPFLVDAYQLTISFDNVLDDLRKNMPSEEESLKKLAELKQDIEEIQSKGLSRFKKIKDKYFRIVQYLQNFEEKIDQWTKDYDYLTEGVGQYEEFDSSDSNYDPQAAEKFSKKISNKYIIEAMEYSPYDISELVLILTNLKENIDVFIHSDSSYEEPNKILDIITIIRKAVDISDSIADWIFNSDDIDDYEYYEIDYAMKKKSKALQKGSDDFRDLELALKKFHDRWFSLFNVVNEYKKLVKDLSLKEGGLINELKSLSKKIKSTKTITKTKDKMEIISINRDLFFTEQLSHIEKLIKIFLRDKMKEPVSTNQLDKLYKEISDVENSILNALKENLSDVVVYDFFTDLTRYNNKISIIFSTYIRPIVNSVPREKLVDDTDHIFVYVHDKDKNDKKIFWVSRIRQIKPLDSLFVNCMRLLSTNGVRPSHYIGFLYLLMDHCDTISVYERGLLSITDNKKPIATYNNYKKICSELEESPSQEIKIPVELINIPVFNDLKLPLPNPHYINLANLQDLSEEIERLYMLITIVLAQFFSNTNRSLFKIPTGSQVVCLIVSGKGEILSWGVNTTTGTDLTCHAEVNALRNYFMLYPENVHLPENVRIFTSLKSCEMCSGAIFDCLSDQAKKTSSVKIIYAQNDPGEENTILSNHSPKIEHKSNLPIFINMDDVFEEHKRKSKEFGKIPENAANSLALPDQQENLKLIITGLHRTLDTIGTNIKNYIEKFFEINKLIFCNTGFKVNDFVANEHGTTKDVIASKQTISPDSNHTVSYPNLFKKKKKKNKKKEEAREISNEDMAASQFAHKSKK